ncbi:MAG: hypothetical protein RIQ89_424 [Bacteroidota bacterium]|jgi:hypothetical protein
MSKAKAKKAIKTLDAVKSMRAIKDQISLEIADLNFEQLKAYFKHKRKLRSNRLE